MMEGNREPLPGLKEKELDKLAREAANEINSLLEEGGKRI